MKKYSFIPTYIGLYLISAILLCGCTLSVNVVHSEGMATDVIDETQTNSPDIKPTVTIPVKPL